MYINKSKIFAQFPDLIFGLSTRINGNNDFFSFNMSKSIGDDIKRVDENRKSFFIELGLKKNQVIVQKQIHSNIVNVVNKYSSNLVGDALITNVKNIGLAISTADCTNIYLYDTNKLVIAAVHSGWGGTEKEVLVKTLDKMFVEFKSNPEDIFVYMAPSISQKNYEVSEEFNSKFQSEYLIPKENKFLLDLKLANKEMLLKNGIPNNQIEISEICSFANDHYHSYRRDKNISGRALGVIALKL